MLSESQERMLVVVRRGHEEEVKSIFSKWDLHAETIGEVTESGNLTVTYKGQKVADVPSHSLVLGGGAPVYIRDARRPSYLDETQNFDPSSLPMPHDLGLVLLRLLSSPNIASKQWVHEQYDYMVRTNNIVLGGTDAAVVLLKEANKALSMTTDCNARYVYLDPYHGGMIAVAEAARNVVCTGATPLAITNCLNFGNPYKPEVYWQFREAVRGIGDACRTLGTPVTGGNVSFYNESPNTAVYPTPVIGMLGLIEDLSMVTTGEFKDEGDAIILVGRTSGEIGGSEYLATVHGLVSGSIPRIDLEVENRVQTACLVAIRSGLVKSAHDCSEGGLAVALAESCIVGRSKPIGASIRIPKGLATPDLWLFGEDQSRIVLTTPSANLQRLLALCSEKHVEATQIGTVGGKTFRVEGALNLDCEVMAGAYSNAIGSIMDQI